jgi:hypothetical protein
MKDNFLIWYNQTPTNMNKILLTTLIATISICGLSQEQYVLDLENKFKLVSEVAESSYIRISANTPVYRTHELTGLIEFEFPKDTTVPVVMYGKTRSVDHPSPEYDKLIKHQITRSFALSTRIGTKWSRRPFFPIFTDSYDK